jgi:serine phosphatase RsbU (regulator of sigma subunit)
MCLIRHADGRVEPLTSGGGPVLGAGEGVQYVAAEIELHAGTQLVLFTDGLPEQPGPDGKQLGMKAVAECVARATSTPADPPDAGDVPPNTQPQCATLVQALHQCLRTHANGAAQRDDVTVMVVGD